ncbi:MAG TPA: hypothetical protein VIJ07_20760 [Dermatophilaceae bacterium]
MWAVAYLVLVAGIAQLALGIGQALLAEPAPSRRILVGEVITWNLGNTAVLAGTVSALAALTDAGGLLLVVALALQLGGTRGARVGWLLRAYQSLILIVLVSIPIGLLLAHFSDTQA